jgi:hypothetical protein
MAKLIGFHNFHISTKAVFEYTNYEPQRKPDYISSSGSKYWYSSNIIKSDIILKLKQAKTDEEWLEIYNTLRKEQKRSLMIFRQSNHWCYGKQLCDGKFNTYKNRISTCKWFLSIPTQNREEYEKKILVLAEKTELCGVVYLHDFVARLTEFERKRYGC